MKMVRLKFAVWKKLIAKLKECMRANKTLNKQINIYKRIGEDNEI